MNFYSQNADKLFSQYQSLSADVVHDVWRDLLPGQPGVACDVGAGSGRDANWLASLGWDVIAVEPCRELKQLGENAKHSRSGESGGITWLEDSLPELKKLRALDQRFQLILLSAVWMHMPKTQHPRAMRILSDLLAPGGILVISLREGPDEHNRFHPVSSEELLHHSKNRALVLKRHQKHIQDSARQDVQWEYLVFHLPDDGTGNLPLLRHIIVNDNKSASYKLGLLRALIRIAESAPGMVLRRSDDYVELPFGLVGLYWLKIYMPLVLRHNLLQAPGANHEARSGYGWASADFYSLSSLSPYDLRVGAEVSADVANRLRSAIADICRNIKAMPARYITFPGQNRQVFDCDTKQVRAISGSWQLNKDTLSAFGSFRVPSSLWQTLSQFACWLEPALVNEWVRLIQNWNLHYDPSVFDRAFQWDEGVRDTSKARARAEILRAQGDRVSCVWTRKWLKDDKFVIDHCFPWSRWFNNDLWNLLPCSVDANSRKGDKLPTAPLLEDARKSILHWWESAYLSDDALRNRFFTEASSALPLFESRSLGLPGVFQAVQHQRIKLKANQQLMEWQPIRPGTGKAL